MANYKAVTNGNWSSLATWQDDSTGSYIASTVLPSAADVVYFNNFTVAIDQDVTVLEIRNNSTTGVTAGGTGTVSTSRTINTNLFQSSGSRLINITANNPSVVNINGTSTWLGSSSFGCVVEVTGNATLNYVGNVFAGTFRGITLANGVVLNFTGDIFGGTQAGSGNATGMGVGIYCNSTNTLNIVGNVNGGTGISNWGISLQGSNNVVNIIGNVNAGVSNAAGNPCHGISGAGIVTVTGNVVGAINSFALNGVNGIIYGNLQNAPDGRNAAPLTYLFLENVNQWEFRKSNLTTNTLYTPGVATGFPSESNVRNGITYGPTNTLTGTCFVPSASTVSLGVPVDNTVGTAQLTADDFLNGITASTSPLAVRLQNVVTTDVLGAQIAAYSP